MISFLILIIVCDKFHAIHASVYEWFGISFDHFGRTSTDKQTEIAQAIFHECDAKGMVLEKDVDQLFCEKCDKFLADRFVRGICPDCQYDDARGDQCDSCGHILNAIDLQSPTCSEDGSSPIVKTSTHLFLDLPTLDPKLREFIESGAASGKWSTNSTGVSRAWIAKGLESRCITRDLKWGTSVPKPGYEDKVFYVWFDAPIGYISITASYTEQWKKWWMNPEDVELVQFMGKDNIPFHTVVFPATLMASGQPWTMLDRINTTEYLNYESGKFSKRLGVGVFGDSAQLSGVNAEVWRYYLLVNRPEQSDTAFTWDDFAAKNNDELLKNLGNLVHRCLTFLTNFFDGKVPKIGALREIDEELVTQVTSKIEEYVTQMEDVKIKGGLKTAMLVSSLGNAYMQHTKPWVLFKEDPELAGHVCGILANLVLVLCTLMEPFMPSFTDKVLSQLALDRSLLSLETPLFRFLIPENHAIGKPFTIFSKIDSAQLKELRAKYAGQNAPQPVEGEEYPLNLLVGEITSVALHPSAEHLYVIEVNTGKLSKTIVSGLVSSYPNGDDLVNKKVLVVNNLKPSNFRGVKSFGMLLCAQAEGQTSLLVPSADVPVGSIVSPNGMDVSDKAGMLLSKKFKAVMKKLKFGIDESNVLISAGGPMMIMGLDVAIKSDGVGAGAVVQ